MHQQAIRLSRFLPALAGTLLVAAATACGPRDPLEQVRLLQDGSGDHAGSLELLNDLLESRPDDPEVHHRHGVALISTGNPSQAIWSLKKALASPAWVERAGMPLAGVFTAIGNHDDAIETYGLVLDQKPDLVPALLGRGRARIASRRHYEEALADADRVLELDPDEIEALTLRALALLALERAEEADLVLQQLEGLYRDDSLALHGSPGLCAARATFAREKGEIELAEKRYEQCLELFPSEDLVLEAAVQFFDDSGRFERSEEVLARALEEAPAAHAIRFHLVRRLLARGATEAAEKRVREATTLPSLADAATGWSNVALWEIDQGRFDAAAEAFAHARELDPTRSLELAFGYADALAVAGRYEQALRVVEETGLPTYQALVRGRVALLRGDPAQALEHLSEGVRLWPDNPMARYYLAVAAEQVGDFALAVEQYRYAMRIDVRSTDAYLRLARLHAAEGRLDEAASILSFQPTGRPEELPAGLLHLEILARLDARPPAYLKRFFSHPDRQARALAAVARGRAARHGPADAAKHLRGQKIDFADPIHAAALEALIEALGASGHFETGLVLVAAGLRQHPEAAAFHALRGRALILSGAPSASARAAYQRALAIDARHPVALVGLARLHAESGEREPALGLYERALVVAPDDRDSARAAAALLVALDRREEAEQRLAGLIRAHPYDAPAALALAELRLARGVEDERTLALARRAVHFRGGPPAEALVERLRSGSKPVLSSTDGG